MSMDGLSLYACLRELSDLQGGKIDKVQQPERDTLLLTLRAGGRTQRLLLCAHAENGRIQRTEQSFQNPAEPPMFCMLLRRRLVGGRIERMEQLGLDRYVVFTVSARSELDDPIELQLHIELMGKHSNITLVQDGIVLDALKHVSPSMSTVRTLLPGAAFKAPPTQDKRSLFSLTREDFIALSTETNPAKAFQSRFSGLSRAAAEALLGDTLNMDRTLQTLSDLENGRLHPVMRLGADGEPLAVFPFLPMDGGSYRCCESLSAAYDEFYEKRDAIVRIQRHGASLRHSLETHLRRAENKLAVFNEALLDGETSEQYRLHGELITANLHRMRRGQSVLQATNYYTDPPADCIIELDPLLSPNENAQRCFKQYRKQKAARAYAESMVDTVQEEIAYLEGQLDNLSKCDTLQELSEIREELVQQGYLKPERRGMKPHKQAPSEPMSFRSSDGISILVGKNNKQNDTLTLRRAVSENIWLHTKNIPGSHVIIDYIGMPPERTLLEAAQLAAYYSKARSSASVPVDYTPRKFVKKPSGAKPGMVIYTTNQTVYVTPDESAVRAMEQREKGTQPACD